MKHPVVHSITALALACLLNACAYGEGPSAGQSGSSTAANTASSNEKKDSKGNDDMPATDPAYKLSRGDEVAVSVFGEGDMSTDQKIDNRGIIRVPFAGEVYLAGRTVREAETYLEKLFVEKKLLKKPMVTIGVRDYASREVNVFGAVNGAGKYQLPREASSVEIVDVISARGGFKTTAKANQVKVTRTLESGEEKTIEVDVEAMMNPNRANANTPRSFLIYPGDRIFVPERLF